MAQTLFTHYETLRILGKGAMGLVYLARDLRDGRIVALKTMGGSAASDNPLESIDYEKRLEREAQLSKQLDHPHIVAYHDAGYENEAIAYLAMEFIDGEPLETLMKRENQLSYATIHQVTVDLLGALGHAHGRGMVHRDIKPANVLLTRDRHAKLADFGIARPEESTLTVAGQRLGTPSYTSPENITGAEISPRSDLFSLGVVIYEMITGQKPFTGRSMQDVLVSVVMKEPAPLASHRPKVDEAWQAFVSKLLAKKPEDRFQSAEEALEALTATLRPAMPTVERILPPMETPSAAAAPPVEPPAALAPEPEPAPAAASVAAGSAAVESAPPPAVVTTEPQPVAAPPPQSKPSFWNSLKKLLGG